MVGTEAGGALKNVVAVAAGIARAMGLGDNALAALATRGLAEMTRVAVRLGADIGLRCHGCGRRPSGSAQHHPCGRPQKRVGPRCGVFVHPAVLNQNKGDKLLCRDF